MTRQCLCVLSPTTLTYDKTRQVPLWVEIDTHSQYFWGDHWTYKALGLKTTIFVAFIFPGDSALPGLSHRRRSPTCWLLCLIALQHRRVTVCPRRCPMPLVNAKPLPGRRLGYLRAVRCLCPVCNSWVSWIVFVFQCQLMLVDPNPNPNHQLYVLGGKLKILWWITGKKETNIIHCVRAIQAPPHIGVPRLG